MQNGDLPKLGKRLEQLAEAFDRKPPGPGAMLVWLDALREFSLHEVESCLVDLPKRLIKFPAPADVWKAANERRSDRIENEAKIFAEKKSFRVSEFPADSDCARKHRKLNRELTKLPRPSKRAWISEIFARQEQGDVTLSPYAVKLAKEAQAAFAPRGDEE